MRTKKISLLAIAIFTFSIMNIAVSNAMSNDIQTGKTITVKLNTIQCDMCVEKVTEAINSIKGVENVTVDLDKKSATVTYNSELTSKKAIESAITSAGYDANERSADTEAYENLSPCCKKP